MLEKRQKSLMFSSMGAQAQKSYFKEALEK